MPLKIWSSADTPLLKTTFGSVIRSFRPDIPEHSFVSLVEGELPQVGPDELVLACGNKALEALKVSKIVPKNRTLSSLRETVFNIDAGRLMLTFDPGIVNREPEKKEIIEWDVRLAVRLLRSGSLKPQLGEYRYVNDYQPMIDWIEAQFEKTGKPVDVACDTETMGFFPWYPDKDVVSISFTAKPNTAEVLYLGPQKHPVQLDPAIPLFDQIQWLLTSPKVKTRFSNGKYDLIWIGEKWGIECTNFKFDNMLVGGLLDENRSNGLNLHAKLFTDIGGYDDCVTPDTRLLTSDLRWMPAGDVKPGDALVGFDENNGGVKGQRRKLRTATAVSTKRLVKPGVEIVFSDGRAIKCSTDHGFLVCTGANGGGTIWRRAYQLKPGSRVKQGAPVEAPDTSFDAGWMAGFLDGEGFLSHQGPGLVMGWSQLPGIVWDRSVELAARYGIEGYVREKPNCGVLTTKFSARSALRLLQIVRPIRLLEKRGYEGLCIPNGTIEVVSVKPIGDVEVVSLETSTHTFIAEGLCSHNSFNAKYDKGKMEQIPAEGDFLTYAGGDTDAAQQVADVFRDELAEDHALTRFYVNIVHPAARAFEKLERRGVVVDVNAMQELRGELSTVISASEKTALEILPNKMRIKYREKIESQLKAGKSPLTGAILKEFFFSPSGLNLKPKKLTAKTGEPSTEKAHLRQFGDVPEAMAMVAALTELDSANKTRSTFVDGFLKHLRPDGRIHPTYFLTHGEFEGHDDDDTGTVCVTEDTLFMTDRGHIPYTQVRIGDQVVSHSGVGRQVIDIVDNGVKPVYRVQLSNGAAINCTGNHPFLVGDQWVRADKLEKRQAVTVLPETEVWRQIEGWPFWVSTWGRIRSAKGTILQQQKKGRWGHLKVCLFRNGAQKRGPDRRDFPVHRLVAEAFVPNPQGLPEVRHLNGIAWDNRPGNLLWGTTAENRDDMRKHGTGQGAHGNQAKVDLEAVTHMRECSLPDKELADIYGVSRELVREIRAFRKWVPREPRNRSVQFSTAKVQSVAYIGDLPTYGVTVADDHSHVTNGIVTHNTGRLSAKNPAFQIIPKKTKWAKKIRRCYTAPPGKLMLQADFSQGELRVVACVAKEQNMIKSYEQGLDLHAVTGAKLGGVSYDEFLTWKNNDDAAKAAMFEDLRGRAKAGNFGLLYGMGVEGFQAYAWAQYGLKLSYEGAEAMRNAFFELYPGLVAYHDKQRGTVRIMKQVRSPLGRIRHLPMIDSWDREIKSRAERQAINSPIQATLTDMMIWSIALIEEAYGDQGVEMVGTVHDSLIAYVPEANAQECALAVQSVMSNLPFEQVGWHPQLNFPADLELGPNMAELSPLKIAA